MRTGVTSTKKEISMDKKQKKFEQALAQAYLKGRVDAQRELYALIRLLEDEIARLKPKNKRSAKNGKVVN